MNGIAMTKRAHSALTHPESASLRKTSMNTTMTNQIQRMNKKSHSSERNTWPTPH
jgi:hypothetical protein